MSDEAASPLEKHDLTALCALHLEREESLLAGTLPRVRAVHAAFAKRAFDCVAAALVGHQDLVRLAEEVEARRGQFRDELARRLQIAPRQVSFRDLLGRLPRTAQPRIAASLVRVRQLADELAATNYLVSVHLRVHLDAYRRIIRDLTNTETGSGRYGPAGTAEAQDYRPLLLVDG